MAIKQIINEAPLIELKIVPAYYQSLDCPILWRGGEGVGGGGFLDMMLSLKPAKFQIHIFRRWGFLDCDP